MNPRNRRWVALALAIGGSAGLMACQRESPKSEGAPLPADTAKIIESCLQPDLREVELIMKDLEVWLIVGEMSADHQRAFEELCRFLSIRYRFDRAVGEGKIAEEEAVGATQPLIDRLAKMGAPMEDVLLRILEARKSMTVEKRGETLCKEDPETFGSIVLWTMKSRRAVPLLITLIKGKTHENRRVFVRALGRIGDPQALDFLRNLAVTEADEDLTTESRTAIAAIEKAAATGAEKK